MCNSFFQFLKQRDVEIGILYDPECNTSVVNTNRVLTMHKTLDIWTTCVEELYVEVNVYVQLWSCPLTEVYSAESEAETPFPLLLRHCTVKILRLLF